MEQRISRLDLYINIAQLVARRSTCGRMNVGAVITADNKIISTGYNGPRKGEPHCSSSSCDVNNPCVRAIHAEHNAIMSASIESNKLIKPILRLYVTHQPCLNCAKLIVKSGISEVYYQNNYRNIEGLQWLLDNNIKIHQIDEIKETQN